MRHRAKFTQADVARAIRAAKQAGAAGVDVLPDGTIRVLLVSESTTAPKQSVDEAPEIVL
jgi:hypothetical protein